jgi:hypothetical protein
MQKDAKPQIACILIAGVCSQQKITQISGFVQNVETQIILQILRVQLVFGRKIPVGFKIKS